jgi:hypothetical protein
MTDGTDAVEQADSIESGIAAVMSLVRTQAVIGAQHAREEDIPGCKGCQVHLTAVEAACRRLVLVVRAEMPCYTTGGCRTANLSVVPMCPSCEARAELEAK